MGQADEVLKGLEPSCCHVSEPAGERISSRSNVLVCIPLLQMY